VSASSSIFYQNSNGCVRSTGLIPFCAFRTAERNGHKNEGIGKPEPLVGDLAGFWSRRINEKDRLIYKVEGNDIYILACRFHYDDH
jgi:hypothetical protein